MTTENNYYPVTLECRGRPEYEFVSDEAYAAYVPCPDLYRGYYDGGVVRMFFFRQGSPTTPECWSQSGPQTINLNKRAMVDDAMGKVFTYTPQPSSALVDDSTTGASLWRYRVYNGKFAVNWLTENGPMHVEDLNRHWINLQYEVYYDYLRGPRGVDGIYEMPRYVYWRYQDGGSWTKVDTGVEFTPLTEEGSFYTENMSITSQYDFENFVFDNDSGNYPNGTSSIQFTAYNAEQFEFLEDYIGSQHPELDPSYITIAKINRDGEFSTYPIASIVDNGSYYTITLDTTDDVIASFDENFEPENYYTYRYDAYDTSSDPPGAKGCPIGTYAVRGGQWDVNTYDRTLRPWISYGFGQWYHEPIWYWRYIDRNLETESSWTRHTQSDGFAENVAWQGQPTEAVPYQRGSVPFCNKWNQDSSSCSTIHFEATSQPSNFPDGVRDIELTSAWRQTDRLFVMFDRPGSRPRLVVDQTIKQEEFGSFYSKGTGTDPEQPAGFYDEATNTVTYVDQSPTREGQVITYIEPGGGNAASMFISVETSPGVFEWKGRS